MTLERATARLTDPEMVELRWAYQNLEHPSLAARLSDVLASPIEEGLKLLPKTWRRRVEKTTEANMHRTLALAVASMGHVPTVREHNWMHKFLAIGTGAVGGFFGPLTVLAELPLTTTLIFRSIADVANSQGEDLSEPEARLACVQVFALGGRTREDEAADLGYYGLRITLGLHFENILEYAGPGEGVHIPIAINLVRAIAARFGVVISDQAAARMIPVAGAVSGALLNYVFIKHYQDVARGHFIVRRLERQYGVEAIRDEYQRLADEEAEAEREFSPVEGW